MKIYKHLIIGSIFLICFLLSNVVSADPTVNSVETAPESPKPLSTFTVLATITGENIISVNVTVSECSDDTGSCYANSGNLPMTLNADGKYEVEVTLIDDKDRSDHVQYAFIINDDGIDYTLAEDDWKTYLDLEVDNGPTNGNEENNNTPGFELLLVIIAMIVGVLIYKKKR